MIVAVNVDGSKTEYTVPFTHDDYNHVIDRMREIAAHPKVARVYFRDLRRGGVRRAPCPYREAAMRYGKRGKRG